MTDKFWKTYSSTQQLDYIQHNILNEEEMEMIGNAHPDFWKHLSCWQHMTEPFIHKHRNDVDWTFISTQHEYSTNFIRDHIKYFKLGLYLTRYGIEEDLARELAPYMTKDAWFDFFANSDYSLDFMREFLPKAKSAEYGISTNRDFTEKELIEVRDWLNWRRVKSYCITEKLMDKYPEIINWYDISKNKTFANTEADRNFILKYQAYLFFPNIDMSVYDKKFRRRIRRIQKHREEIGEKFESFL